MVQLRHRHHATEGRAPSWPGRSADDSISFADITALPEPEWASAAPIVFDASLLEQLPLTDWSARLADAFGSVESATAQLADNTRRCLDSIEGSHFYSVRSVVEPVLAELIELRAVTLVNWRQALRVHAEAELALYDTKAQVA